MASSERRMSATDWKAVQAKLKELQFYFGVVDGLRGPLTDSAIVAFKRSIGFRARPFYGDETHAALFKQAAGPIGVVELPWVANARMMLGLHEKSNNADLLRWFKGSVPDWVNPREVSWCGAFVAVCFRKWDPSIVIPENMLGARQWGNFGEKCNPQRGAVLTFWRGSRSGWQGHVGFMVGQDSSTFHVLGGNQSDAVTIARLDKGRLLQSRWPIGYPQPHDEAYGALAGTISTNEA